MGRGSRTEKKLEALEKGQSEHYDMLKEIRHILRRMNTSRSRSPVVRRRSPERKRTHDNGGDMEEGQVPASSSSSKQQRIVDPRGIYISFDKKDTFKDKQWISDWAQDTFGLVERVVTDNANKHWAIVVFREASVADVALKFDCSGMGFKIKPKIDTLKSSN
jgi:hypothetical protein